MSKKELGRKLYNITKNCWCNKCKDGIEIYIQTQDQELPFILLVPWPKIIRLLKGETRRGVKKLIDMYLEETYRPIQF